MPLKNKIPLSLHWACTAHACQGENSVLFFKPAAPCMLCFRGSAFSRLGNFMVQLWAGVDFFSQCCWIYWIARKFRSKYLLKFGGKFVVLGKLFSEWGNYGKKWENYHCVHMKLWLLVVHIKSGVFGCLDCFSHIVDNGWGIKWGWQLSCQCGV